MLLLFLVVLVVLTQVEVQLSLLELLLLPDLCRLLRACLQQFKGILFVAFNHLFVFIDGIVAILAVLLELLFLFLEVLLLLLDVTDLFIQPLHLNHELLHLFFLLMVLGVVPVDELLEDVVDLLFLNFQARLQLLVVLDDVLHLQCGQIRLLNDPIILLVLDLEDIPKLNLVEDLSDPLVLVLLDFFLLSPAPIRGVSLRVYLEKVLFLAKVHAGEVLFEEVEEVHIEDQ
mmetsp:Transcript_9208/g.8610  ORF Transcript_9208/g.8610 Transcript_9208/m.8610 type:complete len:230 (-) Transcript_9208:166-855(-)